jgi:chromate reductase, NAD(P)H dehydrogenase (quinone)
VCGSLQASSHNLDLLRLAAAVAPAPLELTLFEGLRELPHFDPDLDQRGAPEPVLAWRAAIASSDALLIACPEYGHSLPGVLKNAIDWTIGSGELERKVVAVTAATVAPYRGLLGLQALRQTLAAVSARIVGGEPILRGPEGESAVRMLLDGLLAELTRPLDQPSC